MAPNMYMDMIGGLKMPVVGLRTGGASDEAELAKALNAALDVGYRHIDTANAYQNEAIVGRVLKQWFTSGKLKRQDVFITTKLPNQGMHPDRVELFMKMSLDKLQLDYVDLYLIHGPIATKYIEDQSKSSLDKVETEPTDHVSIWKKMEEQVDAGRARTIGLSNFNIKQVDRILKSSRIKPACLQVELHIYLQQRELVNFCQKNGIVVVAYAPLGSPGFNESAYLIGVPTKKLPDMLNDETVKSIAKKHKKTNAQVLLRYLLEKNIVVIPKSVTPSRVEENFEVFDFALDKADMKDLDGLEIGEEARVFDFDHAVLRAHPEFPFPQ